MSQRPTNVSFRLQLRRQGGTEKWWLVIPLKVGGFTLTMLPNSLAARSVITPDALAQLEALQLVGADIRHLHSGMESRVLQKLQLLGHSLRDLEVQVRAVPELRSEDGQYVVHGYLGLDFFFANFTAMRYEFRTFRMTLEF